VRSRPSNLAKSSRKFFEAFVIGLDEHGQVDASNSAVKAALWSAGDMEWPDGFGDYAEDFCGKGRMASQRRGFHVGDCLSGRERWRIRRLGRRRSGMRRIFGETRLIRPGSPCRGQMVGRGGFFRRFQCVENCRGMAPAFQTILLRRRGWNWRVGINSLRLARFAGEMWVLRIIVSRLAFGEGLDGAGRRDFDVGNGAYWFSGGLVSRAARASSSPVGENPPSGARAGG